MSYKPQAIVAILLAVSAIHGACLDSQVLKDLGFANTQANEKISAPTVCKDLIPTFGTCVPQADIEARIKTDNGNLGASFDIYGDLQKTLEEIEKVLKEATNTADEAKVAKIRDDMKTTQPACVTAYSTVQQGITCFLATGNASANTVVGAEVTVKLDTATVGAELEKCLQWVDGLCLLTTGFSASTGITLDDSLYQNNSVKFGPSCTKLKTYYTCAANDTACVSERRKLLIEVFFKPYDYNFIPASNILTNIRDGTKKLWENTKDFFKNLFDRRLLVSKSGTNTQSTTGGEDAVAHGNQSGADKAKASAQIFAVFVSAVFMLAQI